MRLGVRGWECERMGVRLHQSQSQCSVVSIVDEIPLLSVKGVIKAAHPFCLSNPDLVPLFFLLPSS